MKKQEDVKGTGEQRMKMAWHGMRLIYKTVVAYCCLQHQVVVNRSESRNKNCLDKIIG